MSARYFSLINRDRYSSVRPVVPWQVLRDIQDLSKYFRISILFLFTYIKNKDQKWFIKLDSDLPK